MDKKYDVTWCYNERHHGKGPMDELGGAVKNKVFRDVKSGKVQITGAKLFAEYADQVVKNIKSIFLRAIFYRSLLILNITRKYMALWRYTR